MVTLTCCVRRLPHLSHDAFDRHWRENHAALIRRHADTLRIRGYVQTSSLPDPAVQERMRASRGAEEAIYDGVATLCYDSLDDIWAVRQSPAGAAALREVMEDEARFVDLSKSRFWFGQDRIIIAPEVASSLE
jgi:uncharacterized protein (TIGR02118 family)